MSTTLVATAGQGILRSNDNGITWHRLGLTEPIEFDGVVRSLAVDPSRPERIYAGADCGVCISTDGGSHWRRPVNEINGMTVWSLAVDPVNPQILYAGTGAPSRCALFKSLDAGETWQRLPPEIPEFCSGVNRPRLLTICIDPEDSRQIWFGIEEGGAWRSRDAGASWERVDQPNGAIRNSDIHAIAILAGTASQKKVTLILTVNAIYRSTDDGQTWEGELSSKRFDGLYYTRTVLQICGSDRLVLAMGDGTPGFKTRLYRSNDRAISWQESEIEVPPNSTFWALGSHAADPKLLYAGTKYGDLFRSGDGGNSWEKEWREFSEITAVTWTPFDAPLIAHAQSTQ